MNALRDAPQHADTPEVAALRKRMRGEPLNDAERTALERTYQTPEGPMTPHEDVMRELAERERTGR